MKMRSRRNTSFSCTCFCPSLGT